MKDKVRLAILGFGKMGEALAMGIARSSLGKRIEITGSTRTQETAQEASKRTGIKVSSDSIKPVKGADVVILSVKPHQAQKLAAEISPELGESTLVISICASISCSQLSEALGGHSLVIRAMPNTPCLIGEGMTALAPDSRVKKAQLDLAIELFSTVGQTAVVEEHLLDGVTGLSGCGPAYVYMIIEALSEAGVKVGLPRKTATLLAAQTLLGASKMVLTRGEHPAALKDEVTTPAGCTVDGLMALEEGAFRSTLIKAVVAATRRSEKLR